MKKKLVNFSLSLVVTFLMLLFAEFVIRLLYKDAMVLYPRYQTDVQYGEYKIRRVRPNMQYTHTSIDGEFDFLSNNRGFRNKKDIDYKKDENELRVLCLGDSQIYGMEVDQSQVLTTVMEHEFDFTNYTSSQKSFLTAINSGVSGFGTAEQLVFLKNEGYKYKPDYVVLGFFSNDFRNNQISRLYKVENNALLPYNYQYIPGTRIQNSIYGFGVFEFLGENSYLYSMAFNTIWEYAKKVRYRKAKDEAEEKSALNEILFEDRESFSSYDNLLMTKLIEEMHNFCKQINASLIIIDIPRMNLTSSIPTELVPMFRANSDTLYSFLDMKEEYLKLPKVHVNNGFRHISEETHEFYAEKILKYIYN